MINGIGIVVIRLSKEQTSLGLNVKIATIDQNLAYRDVDMLHTPTVKELNQLIHEWKPDIVLFHSIWAMPYISMASLLKRQNIPYLVMMHGANSFENNRKSHWEKTFANILWFNGFLKKAAGIIYLSKTEFDNCLSKGLNSNYYILPNGCEPIKVDIDSKKLHDPVNIIYLGRLSIYHKGLDYLLDAIGILKSRNVNDCNFYIYGNENDPDIEHVKKRLQNLNSLAHFAGPVYGEKKNSILSNADMFILTSRYEGMPMGVLEALSHGVPCLLTPGTNMSLDVQNAQAGWETQCDAYIIANDILHAISDLRKDSMSYFQAAYNLSKKYNWEVIAKLSLEIIFSVVNNK